MGTKLDLIFVFVALIIFTCASGYGVFYTVMITDSAYTVVAEIFSKLYVFRIERTALYIFCGALVVLVISLLGRNKC